ncbi:MAG TPA: MltA domain-containing protein [Usitatibacteraceae bacterium]|nr:MltA domain-containing protein [Usitatibacteraceae bacterium]
MPLATVFPAPRLRAAASLWLVLLAAACATPPVPVAQKAPEALICPPVEKPVCPTLPPPAPSAPAAPTPVPEVEYRGRLQPASWMDIPDWGREPLRDSLLAFLRGCGALAKQPAWQSVCAVATALPPDATERDISLFFESQFEPYQVINADESTAGMVTGYYEPLLNGSRTRTSRYRYPIYAVPQDLLVIDLSSVYPDLKHKRLRGRIEGNRVVPYLARGDIESDPAPLKGLEIAWVDDAVELFFLHIQGSGQVQLENGERLRVGYADQNGHPFRSLGRMLIQRGELPPERASMQGIKDWARRHPGKVQRFMNENPSFVFFRELPGDLPGPIGSLGVPLTAERSIAVDPRVIPLGVPVYLATTWPNSPQPLNRLMVAQDTGGAINGGVRADFFWGFGDAAGSQAGRMRQAARMWVLLPKGYTPPSTVPAGAKT